MTKEQVEQQIGEIQEEFDWKRVSRAMHLLNWEWVCRDGVPDIRTMKEEAKTQLKRAWNLYEERGVSASYGSGGFMATCDGNYLSLQFTLAEWSCDPEA